MTISYFGKMKVSIPFQETLFVGTSNGLTRIDTGLATKTDFINESSSTDGLKILKGATDNVISVNAENVLSIITSGNSNCLTYLSYENELLSSIDSGRGISSDVFLTADIYNSYGSIYDGTDIFCFTQDIGIYIRNVSIINDDDVVDFGESGELTNFSLPDSQVGVTSDPVEVLVFNDSDYTSTAKVVIGYTGKTEDSYLELSNSELGPFYGIREKAIAIPDDFSWEDGEFINTQVVDSYVTTSGIEAPFIYVSPVIDTYDFSTILNYRLFWEDSNPYPSSIDYGVTPQDGVVTIEVRQGSTAPSGTWTTGELPDSGDSIWGSSGTLEYFSVPNYSIDRINNRYIQFKVHFNPYFNQGFLLGTDGDGGYNYQADFGSTGALPKLNRLGLEIPTLIEGIPPRSSKELYVRSNIPAQTSGTHIRNTLRRSYLDVWWELPNGE